MEQLEWVSYSLTPPNWIILRLWLFAVLRKSSLALMVFLRKILKGLELEHRKWNKWQETFDHFWHCQNESPIFDLRGCRTVANVLMGGCVCVCARTHVHVHARALACIYSQLRVVVFSLPFPLILTLCLDFHNVIGRSKGPSSSVNELQPFTGPRKVTEGTFYFIGFLLFFIFSLKVYFPTCFLVCTHC